MKSTNIVNEKKRHYTLKIPVNAVSCLQYKPEVKLRSIIHSLMYGASSPQYVCS